ncbi:unnamed protein product [Periconia digitata]|uniref:Major facilitator superfamily (MFS) profile domain-containing protein n=1 Tax=Periconia digitata TaxID=1303443 RepID=A0A9W4U3X9_9PLEO|nr:unnamed protein product [Periconia digitata]
METVERGTQGHSERNPDPKVEKVDFKENDPEDPFNWPTWRKWMIVSLVTVASFLGNFGTITIVPAVPNILNHFHTSGKFDLTFLVSIWEFGEAVGQIFIGLATERFGRMPVFLAGNVLFLICSVASALSVNVQMLTAFRFLNGCVNTTLTLGPTIIDDMFVIEQRGRAMAISIAIPLLGPFVAPVVGSYTNAKLGWRWTVWIVVISVAVVTALSFAFFKETYRVMILERKAAISRGDSNTIHCRPKENLFLVAVYSGFTYGISYLVLTTLTDVMQSVYSFSESSVGNAFLARAIGNVIGMALYGLTSDRYLQHKKRKHGSLKPCHRLIQMLLGSVVLPIRLLLYGWTAQKHVHWIVPLLGTGFIGFSMILSILPTNNYLLDTYEVHGASAVAGAAMMMALFATFLPLIGPQLYHGALGIGWGNSLLAILSMCFVPLLLWLSETWPSLGRQKETIVA